MIEQLALFFNKTSERMEDVPDQAVQSVITSPPYYDLKDYGHEGQIGAGDSSYEEFHSRLSTVWEECYAKLRNDGTMWIVADTVMGEKGDIRLLPHHIVKRAREIGFRHQETVIWYKPTSLAGMNPKILANKKEFILLFSKNENPKFDTRIELENSVEDPAVIEGAQLGNIWRFPVKRGSLGKNILHKAPFPLELVKRMMRLSTDVGDSVLDPFLGSGTTACAALELEREIYGYEINQEFRSIIEERIEELVEKCDFS